MKYKGKKLAALLASGLITLGAVSPRLSNLSPNRVSKNDYKSVEVIEEDKSKSFNKEFDIEKNQNKLSSFKFKLKGQISTSNVVLNSDADEFLKSIYIDGTNVKFELIDNTNISGNLQSLNLNGLKLEKLYIYDSEYLKNFEKSQYGDYKGYIKGKSDFINHKKLVLKCSNVSVYNELKFSVQNEMDVIFPEMFENVSDVNKINFLNCEKIWLDGIYLNKNTIKMLNSCHSLKKLFLTQIRCSKDIEKMLKLNIPTLESIILDITLSTNLYNFDFSNCHNLQIFSMGNTTQLEDINGLKGLEKLRIVDFSKFSGTCATDIFKGFEEKEGSIIEAPSVYDVRIALPNNNLIHDISALKNSNIEVLNISSLMHVSSEELYDVVISLKNLKEIIGLEVNNAEMCSEELIDYCCKNKIKHPFTSKSLKIKKEIRRIVSELVTDDMDDFEKIKVLSKYILETVSYDMDNNTLVPESSELIDRDWGENLYYTLMEGKGVCTGYSEIAEVLFTEAGVKVFKQETLGHAFTLVEVEGQYYQIDLTQLDYWLEESKISTDDFEYDVNSQFYLNHLGEKEIEQSNSEPYKATQQKQRLNKKMDKNMKIAVIVGLLLALGGARVCLKKDLEKGHLFEHADENIKLEDFDADYALDTTER